MIIIHIIIQTLFVENENETKILNSRSVFLKKHIYIYILFVKKTTIKLYTNRFLPFLSIEMYYDLTWFILPI
jgi:hypothetical protein